jgi:hypothetical protein
MQRPIPSSSGQPRRRSAQARLSLAAVGLCLAFVCLMPLSARASAPTAHLETSGPEPGAFSAKAHGDRLGSCDMYIPGSAKQGILCASSTGGNPNRFQEALLLSSGRVRICSDSSGCPWIFDDPDPGPTFGPGHVVTKHPFRCRVMDQGIECKAIGTGRGFLINTVEARRIGPPAGGARRTEPLTVSDPETRRAGSCGWVVIQGVTEFRLSISNGSPSCATVRKIAKRYGHPISKHPHFLCGHHAYECEYSDYPEGWYCGGLFQGTFQCWHGAASPLRADEGFTGTERTPKRAGAQAPPLPDNAVELHERAGSSHCGPVTVGGSRVKLRVRGNASCSTAGHVSAAYRRKAAHGECEGNGCFAVVPPGWDCVENISATLLEETGEVANREMHGAGIRILGA